MEMKEVGMAKPQEKAGKRGARLDMDFNAKSVFLHIPKTGGTGLRNMLRTLAKSGYEAPVEAPHNVNMERMLDEFSRAKACFLLRDPIERASSAFLSRLRMGRPYNNLIWDHGEAIS
jgi:hypothetical protein